MMSLIPNHKNVKPLDIHVEKKKVKAQKKKKKSAVQKSFS